MSARHTGAAEAIEPAEPGRTGARPPRTPRDTIARALPATFGALAVVHLGALLTGAQTVEYATKPALMPVLAAYVIACGGPGPLAVALLCGCGGDTLLQIGGDSGNVFFLAGMGSFALGHLCYLVLFVRDGERPGRALTGPLATVCRYAWAGYALAALGTVTLLWPGLPAELRIPVAGYSVLLTAMAYGALRAGARAALGGALFLASDTLIATGIADWLQPPVPQFFIMLLYIGAQWLLTDGALRTASGRITRTP